MSLLKPRKTGRVDAGPALSDRPPAIEAPERHAVLDTPLRGPFPQGVEQAVFGMGCFWGAERIFWETPGVYTTAVGYAGGFTENPTYDEACSGETGHAEVVLVAFEKASVAFEELLRGFWEGHDPTQGPRQGNDVGTQYRSIVLCRDEAQRRAAQASRDVYQRELTAGGRGQITTEIVGPDPPHPFYYAEPHHQQYLARNPGGYCGLGGTGVACPVSLSTS